MQVQNLEALKVAEAHMAARQHAAARPIYDRLLADTDFAVIAHLRLSLIASADGRYRDSVEHALGAYEARRPDSELLEMVCKRLLTFNEIQAAMDCASSSAVLQTRNSSTLAELGKLMSDHAEPELALELLGRARRLGLDSPAISYLIGLSLTYVGDLETAEYELKRSLDVDPDFARSARALSRLKRQTVNSNRIDLLRASIARLGEQNGEAPLLYYSLFKELDDLGEIDDAWQALVKGMRLRRRQVKYDSTAEAALFEHLHRVETVDVPTPSMDLQPIPIFIVGMPRSGTTMLDRVLGAHPDVANAGELRDMLFQMRWMSDCPGGPQLDLDLARRAEWIDLSELGQRYLAHTQWRAGGRRFYTDKLPLNFLLIGHIARALPHARILHMVRDPMDTCFSNLKELFGGAYPHSYEQTEMADYFLRYRRLMEHWHTQFPGRILDVHYDALVADPEHMARKVLHFCGLPWVPAVTAIETRKGVVATASTTQVREAIHQRYVGQWRRYEFYLQPLYERLGNPV